MTADDIKIRTTLEPGDIGYMVYLHGTIYKQEYNYGLMFETYVAEGLVNFYKDYDEQKDRVWICEQDKKIIGSLVLAQRGNNSCQLRYFLILPAYRNIGLGKKLMDLFMQFVKECNYDSCYLWTTNEQQKAASLYKAYGFILTEEIESTGFGKCLTEQRYDWNKWT
jgi:N-acetylglutamate synthase-like GNAT family acetyltransferase